MNAFWRIEIGARVCNRERLDIGMVSKVFRSCRLFDQLD